MINYINKIKSYIVTHKKISIVLLIVILGIGYWGYNKFTSTAGDTRYLTAKVEKGTIIASISGSGQVSSLNEVDVKAKASGDVIYLAAKNGQKINAGGLIAQLDDKDIQKSIRDAELNLESAKISFNKFKIQNSDENLQADLAKAYDDGFNTVSNAFLDLPGIMTGLNNTFFETYPGTSQWTVDWYAGQAGGEDQYKATTLKESFIDSYNKAKKSYDINFDAYKTISRTSDSATIETLTTQTYNTTKLISDTIKNANNYIDFVNDSIQNNNYDNPAIITTHKATLNTYTSKTNTHLVNLLGVTTNIKDYKDAFPNTELDTQSENLSIKQKENSLQDLKDKLADYFIRAPFAGTISVVNIKKGDSVSSGTSIATLATNTQIAEISLNEVDVAKIKIGQKATLTFDAIPDLTISGVVVDIDAIGTVSQGVVTYTVKISFDTQDDRVKPAMSVSAAIITDIKQDVLAVPNSAIKSLPANSREGQAGKSYVEMFDTSLSEPIDGLIGSISKITPKRIPVEIGLTNDTQSEIISGLKDGDEIIARTILPTATTTATPSLFGNTGGSRANTGGGNVRIQAR
ncbi:MAG: HlyD family efflux transporter periplasmic adaptor subunit [Candidatus Parcubacteria bacterium]|nr:HlyD family efflux transporter periplasmic adaptor subunit [Candidatus Parcubacteria bacterium]